MKLSPAHTHFIILKQFTIAVRRVVQVAGVIVNGTTTTKQPKQKSFANDKFLLISWKTSIIIIATQDKTTL